jgi:hypothetical protein
MKRKICFLLAITLAVILFASCRKSNDAINEQWVFKFQGSGSMTGIEENLKINTNSTYYSITIHYYGSTGKPKSYETTIKTPGELWSNLIKTFELETFTKIKDGGCRACLDGIDETFSYTNAGKTYSIYNGTTDEHFQQMQDFFDLMYEQIDTFKILAGVR